VAPRLDGTRSNRREPALEVKGARSGEATRRVGAPTKGRSRKARPLATVKTPTRGCTRVACRRVWEGSKVFGTQDRFATDGRQADTRLQRKCLEESTSDNANYQTWRRRKCVGNGVTRSDRATHNPRRLSSSRRLASSSICRKQRRQIPYVAGCVPGAISMRHQPQIRAGLAANSSTSGRPGVSAMCARTSSSVPAMCDRNPDGCGSSTVLQWGHGSPGPGHSS